MTTPRYRRPGRPPGSKNQLTLYRERAIETAREKITSVLGPQAFRGDALAFLIAVYSDPTYPLAIRVDAAKAALPFEKPRLNSIDFKNNQEPIIVLFGPGDEKL